MTRNINSFVLSGFVNRVTVITGGSIISLTNRRDYKKDDEWVESKNFLSVTTWSKIVVEEGDFITVSGEIGTYKNKDGNTTVSLRADVIENHGKQNRLDEKSEKKAPAKKTSKPKSEDDEDADLW